MLQHPLVIELAKTRPGVAISARKELDEHFRWDGDGPDPVEDGLLPYDVDIFARTIIDGELLEGTASLGGCYLRTDEPPLSDDGELHGYFPQKLEEALKDLDRAIARHKEKVQ